MKNNKTLRQILTGLIVGSLIGLIVTAILTIDVPQIIAAVAENDPDTISYLKMWSLWVANDKVLEGSMSLSDPVVVVNYKIAAGFLALAAIALISAGLKLGMCSIPSLKETKSPVALILDCLLIVGVIIAIIGLFAPMFMKAEDMHEYQDLATVINAALVLIGVGAPVALGATAVSGAINLKAAK